MGIQHTKLKELAEKYRAGLCTAEELKQINACYNEFETNGYALPPAEEIDRASREAAQFVIGQIKEQQKESFPEQARYNKHSTLVPVRKKISQFVQYAAAAILLIFMGLGAYYYNLKPVKNTAVHVAQNDLGPGSNKAVLTLSNGRQISLNSAQNGNLAQQGGTVVHKTENGLVAYLVNALPGSPLLNNAAANFNTVTTPRGGQYQVILPDGTKAWLNSLSSIHFPVVFTGNERNVKTTGEVYFEVTKDKSKPFRVSSAGQTVTVLGTHFNIMAYRDEPEIITTLLEGSVRIAKDGQSKTLKPGEQAHVDQDIKVVSTDTEDAIAWKNGLTAFTDADLKTIMRKVSRWYDIEVKYQGNNSGRTFTGAISRRSNLSALFKILELNHIQYSLEGNTLIVKQ
ncbi:putative anti-sigma factor [Arcticibacter svalbardensis MN12-7]|uniref:Putative anti-sigma factor n=1 Tax=Arcticibacter svalbardensis MN12-7 TaxID=1150600 RepID=R9GYF0_9SPHI|nr:FecR family protein [Arcticibacter svalbardensis]EOR96530.1 putative anti-sigma factor [Arcticibacter svalbardensis MN12-7]